MAIASPLVIPKSQFLDAAGEQKRATAFVVGTLIRKPMTKTVQLQTEMCYRTIEIQKIWADGMLATELKSGKSAGP
jgi:hypothetical protein